MWLKALLKFISFFILHREFYYIFCLLFYGNSMVNLKENDSLF